MKDHQIAIALGRLSLLMLCALIAAEGCAGRSSTDSEQLRLWTLSLPSQTATISRLGVPDMKLGSGIQSWRYTLSGDRVLYIGWWGPDPKRFAYASLSSNDQVLWMNQFGTDGKAVPWKREP